MQVNHVKMAIVDHLKAEWYVGEMSQKFITKKKHAISSKVCIFFLNQSFGDVYVNALPGLLHRFMVNSRNSRASWTVPDKTNVYFLLK